MHGRTDIARAWCFELNDTWEGSSYPERADVLKALRASIVLKPYQPHDLLDNHIISQARSAQTNVAMRDLKNVRRHEFKHTLAEVKQAAVTRFWELLQHSVNNKG